MRTQTKASHLARVILNDYQNWLGGSAEMKYEHCLDLKIHTKIG